MSRLWTVAVASGSVLAVVGLVNTLRNLRIMRTPPAAAESRGAQVSVLLPLRDEAHRVRPCLAALAEQEFDELVVLDDASTDGTSDVVSDVLGDDDRLVLLRGTDDPPSGWLGKPWACQRLADVANGDVLLFLDADVVLEPDAVRRCVTLLTDSGTSALCPYPRQVVHGILGRLVQPLLQWSWLTTLPLDIAERSRRPSTAAGNGQLLVAVARDYREIGGHSAVRTDVLEDVALIRRFKECGFPAGMADGTNLAECTMYRSDHELILGYTKSLWSAFGSPVGAIATVSALSLTYIVPVVAAAFGPDKPVRLLGAAGYTAAVLGRWLVARRTGQHTFPDCAAHPISIGAFAWLVFESFRRHRRGTLNWRGRPVAVAPGGSELFG